MDLSMKSKRSTATTELSPSTSSDQLSSSSTVISDDLNMEVDGDNGLDNKMNHISKRSKPKKAKKLPAIEPSPSTSSATDLTAMMEEQETTVDGEEINVDDSDSGSESDEKTEPYSKDNSETESLIFDASNIELDGISDSYFSQKAKKPDKFFEKNKNRIAEIPETDFIEIVRNEFEFRSEPYMSSMWFSLLMENINIILYGYGSKISILQRFAETQLKGRRSYITINGYKPNPVLKDILDCFKQTIEHTDNKVTTDPDKLIEIMRNKYQKEDLVVIIHSIDMLIQDQKSLIKPFLLRLFSPGSRIHLIASSDHVNFSFQWSNKDVGLLNLHMICQNTGQPYLKEREAKYKRVWPLFIDESDKKMVGYDSILLVYESSNETSQKIFLIILDEFLKTPKKSSLKFSDFKKSLQDAFGKKEDAYYKAQLIEFTSHGLLKFKKQDVGEMVQFNIDRNDAQRFLDLKRYDRPDIF